MQEEDEIKEAELYKRYSTFITVVAVLFGLFAYLLRNISDFAIDVFSFSIVGFIVGLLTLFFWSTKLKKLKRSKKKVD